MDETKIQRKHHLENLSIKLSEEETEYRKNRYPDVSVVTNLQLQCTICHQNILLEILKKRKDF